ncbi:MAG: hypothetical protein QY312_00605 [Candidatus Dojkabacteria bacterium]|nr:MAG: hypothetical protein QY312_00605 [Candidatus Dojkabacteria bacterium]
MDDENIELSPQLFQKIIEKTYPSFTDEQRKELLTEAYATLSDELVKYLLPSISKETLYETILDLTETAEDQEKVSALLRTTMDTLPEDEQANLNIKIFATILNEIKEKGDKMGEEENES